MDIASVGTVADRRPERVAEHVSECDPLVQTEELSVDRKGRILDRQTYLNGLICFAVCLSVDDFESGCAQKYASRRSGNPQSATGVC